MVMEAPPSPQCVGREFVRQYYTLLNQAPAHLHRFYNNNSSFVHGGLDSPNRETKPVVGQKQIHQKIQQLNFRDCHAKISQVDSQATLGDGVVVQVTGELSNSGQPMRRFTQTFVLAAQTPKKFYVHNDIFRYQDMLFNDEDAEGDSIRSEAEEELEQEHSPNPDIIHANAGMTQHAYYNNTSSSVVISPQPPHMVAPPPPTAMAPPQTIGIVNGQAHPDEVAPPAQQVMAAPVAAVPVLAQPVATLPPLQPQPQPQPQPQQQPPPEPEDEEPEEEETPQQGDDTPEEGAPPADAQAEEKPAEVPETLALPPPAVHHTPEAVSNEPKTYATLVKSGGPLSFASAASGLSSMTMMPTMKTTEVSPPPAVQRSEGLGGAGRGGPRPTRGSNQVRGVGRPERQTSRPSYNEDSPSPSNGGVACGVGDGLDRRPRPPMGGSMPGSQYTDSQQLFLGNLPHSATEEDLKELFGKFGPIIDLRIHSKANAKGMVGNRVPNYGFIIFEDASIVQRVLDSRPIWFPNDGPNGLKLNVEEKKTRPRQSMDPGRDNRDRMSDNRNSDNPSRTGGGDPRSGGGPRGGGGMRGGPGGPRGPRGGFTRGGGGMRGGGQFQQRR